MVLGLAFDDFRKTKLHNEFFKQQYSQGKTLFSTRIYQSKILAASDLSGMFPQSIKLSEFRLVIIVKFYNYLRA